MGIMIELDFGNTACPAELFDTPVARELVAVLPLTIELTSWGNELYGTIDRDLGQGTLVPEVPPGGLAYTRRGNYLCIFFGQAPAWEVEHIGTIIDGKWKVLSEGLQPQRVIVKKSNR